MRVLSIGLDSRVADPSIACHVGSWVHEISHRVDAYVVVAESADGRDAGPIPISANATVWLVGGSKLTFPFRAARLAAGLHARHPFDVITTEDPIRAGLAGLLLARKTGLPLNIENHSFHVNEKVWLQEATYHHVYNRVAIAVCRRADSIRNYSDGQVDALLGIGVQRTRMRTVPIAAPEISPVAEDVARKNIDMGVSPFVLCAGRMVAYKNVETLLEAFNGVDVPEARLLVIGDGPARAGWQQSEAAKSLGGRLVWRDNVPFEAMASYYSAASVFAAPAVHETGPRTVLEALICGCPVIVTPEMGVVHSGTCVDDASALVVAADDVEGWTRAMTSLLNDTANAQRMATCGRSRIGPEMGMPAIAQKLVELLEDTIRWHGPDTP